MRKRIIGVAAVGLVALGVWISNLWQGLGLGGRGTGEGISVQDTDVSNSRDVDLAGDEADRDRKRRQLDEPREFITIVVHRDRYRLTSSADPRTGVDVSLREIQQRLGDVPGDDHGIRVRVLFERSAQEGARTDLHAALGEAGVKREEVQEVFDFVD